MEKRYKSPIISNAGQGWSVIANLKDDVDNEGEVAPPVQPDVTPNEPEILSGPLKPQDENDGARSPVYIYGESLAKKRQVQAPTQIERVGTLAYLKSEVNALGSRIEGGKSNFPIIAVGMGALGLSGLGILGYSLVKRVATSLRLRREKVKKKEREAIVREIMGDGYDTDQAFRDARRVHAKDFKLFEVRI